ncbi:Fpg/Nei family DNA glycosylase [Propionicimonas sp.]|uniref:Fpg/Nei family DNA glycosylase n=1 Tax=Propionicimonas sp. TaxID=1955623 RepID=UPI0039E70E23
MPELPEVEALRGFLTGACVGKVVARTELVAFACLKTFELPLGALNGLEVDAVARRGKFVCLSVDGLWLVFHLARGGWLTWKDAMPQTPARPGRGPLALRVVFDDDSGFDLTEAGTQKRLAVYVVTRLEDVPGIATLGPDPLADDFTPAVLDAILERAGRAQLKGVLRDQRIIAGIGNAYSDEILHAARLSPFKPSNALSASERETLHAAIRSELADAVARSAGLAAKQLKGDKKLNLRVHGRAGQPCAVCGTTIAEVSFADSSLQYCPGCQTGGKLLADRRLSRLLK